MQRFENVPAEERIVDEEVRRDNPAKNAASAEEGKKRSAAAAAEERRKLVRSQDVAVKPTQVELTRSTGSTAAATGDTSAAVEHLFMLDVFHVVLDKTQQGYFPGHLFLPQLGAEIAKSGGPKLLPVKYCRPVLLEARTLLGMLPYMRYLLGCFSRVQEKASDARYAEWAAKVQNMVVGQAVFTAQESLQSSHGRDDVVLALLQEPPENALHSVRQFVRAMASNVMQEGGGDLLDKLFGGSLSGAQFFVGRLSLLDNFDLPFSVMQYLLDDANIAQLALHKPSWIPPSLSGRDLEMSSFLGPFFRMSLNSSIDVLNTLFPEGKRNEYQEGLMLGRRRLLHLQQRQQSLCRSLLRHPEGRSKLLHWFKQVASSNKIKARTVYDANVVSSNGFLLNCTATVARLFLEVRDAEKDIALDPTFWLVCDDSLGWEKETPLCGTDTVGEFRLRKRSSAVNIADRPSKPLLNDLGYTALSLFHSTGAGLLSSLQRMQDTMRQHQNEIEALEATRLQWDASDRRALHNKRLQDLKQDVAFCERDLIAASCLLEEPDFQSVILGLFNSLCATLLRAAGKDASATPDVFAAFPEFLVEDMADFLPYTARSGVLTSCAAMGPVLEFLVIGMGHPTLISNKHLRGKLAQALSQVPPAALIGSPAVERKLASSCVSVWVAVEETGRHNQWYEKLYIRQNVMTLFQTLRGVEWWDRSVLKLWKEEKQSYIRFVYLLVSDTEFILDHAFSKLNTIASIESAMEETVAWNAQTEEIRKSKEDELQSAVQQAKGGCQFASSLLDMVTYLTELAVQPLMCDELCDKVTCMINFYLRQMVGKKYGELNVRHPERFKFEPREMLLKLMSIFLRLGKEKKFVESCAKDLRSFVPEEFRHGLAVLARNKLGTAGERAQFQRLIDVVEEMQKTSAEEDQDDDAPEEFHCELMGNVMEDPVKLPSGKICDRSTILRHMLSSEFDPYSKQKLTVDMLQPQTELADKIREWKRQKKQAK